MALSKTITTKYFGQTDRLITARKACSSNRYNRSSNKFILRHCVIPATFNAHRCEIDRSVHQPCHPSTFHFCRSRWERERESTAIRSRPREISTHAANSSWWTCHAWSVAVYEFRYDRGINGCIDVYLTRVHTTWCTYVKVVSSPRTIHTPCVRKRLGGGGRRGEDGNAHVENRTVTRRWAMGVREGDEGMPASGLVIKRGTGFSWYTVVGRILICGVGFGDGVLEPSTPDHPLSWSCFSVSPEHPAGNLTSSGEDASCVVVQSAASREIVVGLNASSRGAMKEGMENAQDGGGGKVVLIAESLPRVYIAAVAASRESSTASSYTTPTASYFRVLSVPFGYPITERGGFLPPPLFSIFVYYSLSFSFLLTFSLAHSYTFSPSFSLLFSPASLSFSLCLPHNHFPSLSFLLSSLRPSLPSSSISLPHSIYLAVAPLALSAHTPRFCPLHLFLGRCLSLPRVAYVCL